MAKTMTASTMTDGQIDNVVAKLRDALRKHRKEFGSESVQQVLGTDNLGMRLLEPFRKLADAISNLIVRRIQVNRSITPQEALKATGRKQYVDDGVVANMPQGEGDEAEVVFFKLGRWVNDDELEKEYELRGLVPADPFSLSAVNAADPTFADEHPNGTHWKDSNGKWCYAAFRRRNGERSVDVDRGDSGWDDGRWFAGRRK